VVEHHPIARWRHGQVPRLALLAPTGNLVLAVSDRARRPVGLLSSAEVYNVFMGSKSSPGSQGRMPRAAIVIGTALPCLCRPHRQPPHRARRPPGQHVVRTTTLLVIITALALLVPGCGGSASSAGSGGSANGAASTSTPSTSEKTLAFASCMRAHGVPNFPDPNNSGQFNKVALARLAAANSQFPSAQSACKHLLPSPPPTQQRQTATQALRFSLCVRAHGVTNFPDPDNTGRIPDPASFGIDQGSPQFEAANQACGKYRPPYIPSNAAYNAYARTQAS